MTDIVRRVLLEVDGALDVGVEFHSLSKTFNITRWRIGFVVGRAKVVDALRRVKSNLDSGAFQAVQEAGIAALSIAEKVSERNSQIYRAAAGHSHSWSATSRYRGRAPRATFYVWPRVPAGYDSASFVSTLIEKAGVACIPGNGFGKEGEGYVRFALTADARRLQEASARLATILA